MFTHDGTKIPTAPYKDPDSTVDYGCDWTAWLQTGEIITTSTWTASGLTKGTETNSAGITSVLLSGGTVGTSYTVTNQIDTDQGRIEQRSMIITVKEK